MKWYSVLLQIVLAILLFALFLSSSVFLTLAFKPLYYIDMKALNVRAEAAEYGVELTDEEIRRNYNALIDYNLPLSDGELVFPDLDMSDQGRQHFAEVKDIFDAFKVVALVTLPLCAVGVYFFHKEKNKYYLPLTAGLCVGLPLVGGGLIALNWDKVFVQFHMLFFDNDYWIFLPSKDPVITILPDEFFMHCAIMILALVVTEGLICLFLRFLPEIVRRAKAKRTTAGGEKDEPSAEKPKE